MEAGEKSAKPLMSTENQSDKLAKAPKQQKKGSGERQEGAHESRLARSPLDPANKHLEKQLGSQNKAADLPTSSEVFKANKQLESQQRSKDKDSSVDEGVPPKPVSRSRPRKLLGIALAGSNKLASTFQKTAKEPHIVDQADTEKLTIRVECLVTGFKPFDVVLPKASKVSTLNNLVKNKLKMKHFALYHKEKELSPENTFLSGHGITSNTKVRLHVKAQSGTSDKEDILSLLRLSKSLHDIKSIMQGAQKDVSSSKVKVSAVPKKLVKDCDVISKLHEDRKTRDKMSQLREKMARRSLQKNHGSDKQMKKKTPKQEGSSPPSKHSSTNSEDLLSGTEDATESSEAASPIRSLFDQRSLPRGRATPKELMLFFDPPESHIKMRIMQQEMFDPPQNQTALGDMRLQFETNRCALCHSKLPLALQAMQCRCKKVYCQAHRSPFEHRCSVDLKTVDRTKLQHDTPRVSTPIRKDDDDPMPIAKSSKRPPSR